jgi:hypothetical protein
MEKMRDAIAAEQTAVLRKVAELAIASARQQDGLAQYAADIENQARKFLVQLSEREDREARD